MDAVSALKRPKGEDILHRAPGPLAAASDLRGSTGLPRAKRKRFRKSLLQVDGNVPGVLLGHVFPPLGAAGSEVALFPA